MLVVDQLGAIDKNPPCSDTSAGKLDTYLSKDVPDWIRANLPVADDRADRVIAGYSHGGECAAYLGAKHPGIWANVVDISGKKADNGELNEHVWYDFPTIEKFTTALTDALSKADPAQKATFAENAEAFSGKLTALQNREAELKTKYAGEGAAITEPVPLYMLDAIGRPENAAAWLEGELKAGRRIMGMGHRIYRVRDPRAAVLERAIERLERGGLRTDRLALARAVERAAEELLRQRYPDRPLRANVEFYTAVLLDAVGLDRTLFSPAFACVCSRWNDSMPVTTTARTSPSRRPTMSSVAPTLIVPRATRPVTTVPMPSMV